LIDLFTLALTHGLIALALWRLLSRDELDVEDASAQARRPWLKGGAQPADNSGEAEASDA